MHFPTQRINGAKLNLAICFNLSCIVVALMEMQRLSISDIFQKMENSIGLIFDWKTFLTYSLEK